MNTLYMIGDSVFDCGHYNDHLVTPGELIEKNRDDLFPDFRGRDLVSVDSVLMRVRRLAWDGATVKDLAHQVEGVTFDPTDLVAVSIGGNDFLRELYWNPGEIDHFAANYDTFLSGIDAPRKFILNVYDPFFGKNMENSLFYRKVDLPQIRAHFDLLNWRIGAIASWQGTLVDLRSHFLTGDPSWFELTIEPSLIGASEVRRVIWDTLTSKGIVR